MSLDDVNKRNIGYLFSNKAVFWRGHLGFSIHDSPMSRGIKVILLIPFILITWVLFPLWLPIEIIGIIFK